MSCARSFVLLRSHAEDVIRIAAVARRGRRSFRVGEMAAFVTEAHIELLRRVEKGPYAMSLARGNAMDAKKLRQDVAAVLADIMKHVNSAPNY